MNYKDIKGQRFGHLTVIRKSKKRNAKGQMYWVCKCDCGQFLVVRGDNLRNGNSQQCSDCATHGTRSIFCEEGDADAD